LFWHRSDLHGQAHVARVMVHAFRLVAATGPSHLAPALWAAVYLHDIARRGDGVCTRHGTDAWDRLSSLPDVRALFGRGGVTESDYPAIRTAVVHHCQGDVALDHPHWRLSALLKDADALDRVRIDDLDHAFLRFPETLALIRFAGRLFVETRGRIPEGPDHFARLWPQALRIANEDVTERSRQASQPRGRIPPATRGEA